jgi:hypothetical protein
MDNEALKLVANYGGVAVIFLFAIKEFFAYLKSRKDNPDSMAEQLKLMNTNHLAHMQQSMHDLVELGKVNSRQHEDQIRILSLIEGKLSK